MLGVAFRPEPMTDFITGPGKAADVQVFVRVRQLDQRLRLSVLQQALDHRVAVEEDGVVGLEFDLSIQRGSGRHE